MSLYVVARENVDWWLIDGLRLVEQAYFGFPVHPPAPLTVPVLVDCNERDGEWPAVITLPHETVEWTLEDGRLVAVPLFEGDVERIEWERRRRPAGQKVGGRPGA